MGYRSDVSFCIQIKDVEEFVALMKVDNREMFRDFMRYMWIEDFIDDNGRGRLHFHCSGWKWYDESEKAFTEIMNMAENYDKDFACRFARFGEEMDDTVEEGFGEQAWDLEYPYVDRVIETGIDMETAVKIID